MKHTAPLVEWVAFGLAELGSFKQESAELAVAEARARFGPRRHLRVISRASLDAAGDREIAVLDVWPAKPR
jgi:hypothetical protein